MVADLTAVTYFAPIASFFLVFLVCVAVLFKTKVLGENKWVQIFLSFVVSAIFISFAGTKQYVLTVVPWIAVLLIALAFILMMFAFIGKDAGDLNKKVGVVVLITFAVIFIVSLFFVFSNLIYYLPGPGFGSGGDEKILFFLDWLYSPRVVGAIVLVVIGAIVSWFLTKK